MKVIGSCDHHMTHDYLCNVNLKGYTLGSHMTVLSQSCDPHMTVM